MISKKKRDKNEENTQKLRIGRLKTPEDVLKYMERCIRKAESGGDAGLYHKCCQMAVMLLGAMENADRISAAKKINE